MRSTDLEQEAELRAFAMRAAAWFAANPEAGTFGRIRKGEYMALRWGMGDDCVLVVKQDDDFEPVNYRQAIAAAAKGAS